MDDFREITSFEVELCFDYFKDNRADITKGFRDWLKDLTWLEIDNITSKYNPHD
jgi:hypothetical protein